MSFLLSARLGGMAPTLYVPMEEPEAASAQGTACSCQICQHHCVCKPDEAEAANA